MCPLDKGNNFIRFQTIQNQPVAMEIIEEETSPPYSPHSPPEPPSTPFSTQEEFNDEITPPQSPPSPPGPPAPQAPLWNQEDFNFHINMVLTHLAKLENKVMGPHIICIDGIQHLRPHTGQHWQDKLHYLLFETKIPYYWIIDCIPDDDDGTPEDEGIEDDQPSRVHMYIINHHVKNKIFTILSHFIRDEYNNKVTIE